MTHHIQKNFCKINGWILGSTSPMRCVKKVCDPVAAFNRQHCMRNIWTNWCNKTSATPYFPATMLDGAFTLHHHWPGLCRVKCWPYLTNGNFLFIIYLDFLKNSEALRQNETVCIRSSVMWRADGQVSETSHNDTNKTEAQQVGFHRASTARWNCPNSFLNIK